MANVLHATLEEVEPGLFKASYPGALNGSDHPQGGQLPDSHIATSPESIRTFVEQMARGLGFDRVEWHDAGR